MYDNTSLRILEQVYTKPGIHKRELSKQLKLGMPSIEYALRKIGSLVKKKKSGNQINYYLDYSKELLTPLLYNIEYIRLQRLPSKAKIAIRDFMKDLPEKPILSVLFGSYAKGDYTPSSDIDILLVFQKINNNKKIEDAAKKISLRAGIELNPIYLGYNQFKESFHNTTKQFFKNLKEEKILLTGIEWWRQLKDEET